MRIGLDGYPLSEPLTGVGHYTLELARSLARNFPKDEFELVSPKPFNPAAIAAFQRESIPNLLLTEAKSSSLRGHWWSVGLPMYARRARFDLFHGTNFEVPLWKRRRAVLTIHDLSTLLYPETHRARAVRRARVRLPIAAKIADAIITPTEAVRQEVCERLKVKPGKVTAIHEAPRRTFSPMTKEETVAIRKRLRVEDEFLLFVGTLEPRKNLLTMLRAFEEVITRTSARPQLVIAGGEGWLIDETLSFMNSASLKDRIQLTGYLNDEDLRALYSSSRAFVYPSLYEGFGLPPLEAMACGAPVIASRIATLRETLGEAAILVEPLDVQTLSRTIVEALKDERRRAAMREAGIKHAAKFSWDEAARRTHEVYERVLAP
ncbi:MAG TPA: glycosyltransferase family 1 protein [Pyrinomonadaceae bacterium]|nr:glycosyltransferase family 1 protein [Pyrinomonadaceae bacterium]